MSPPLLPFVFFLLLLLFILSSPLPSFSIRLRQPPILTVRGDGISPLSVDESEISATIQSRIESPTPIIQTNDINRTLLSVWLKSVANKTAATTDKINRYFQMPDIESKIKKLRTLSLSTTPLSQWKDGLMYYYGAESSHSIAFQTSINASGPIIDDLIRLGVTRIDNVRLVSSDEAQRYSRMNALKNATKNAWRKIKASIEPLGWNIGEIEEDKNIVGEDPNKNVNVEIISMNIEGVTIRPPPQPREMLSSMGYAARMDSAFPMAPSIPPMPSSTVFASDATMTASVVLRVKLTKINSGTDSGRGTSNKDSTSNSNKNSGIESEIAAASIISTTNSNSNNNNININNHHSTATKIHRSSTGLYGTTGVVIANNNNNDNDNNNNNYDTIDASSYLNDAEVEEMMNSNNENNYE